MDSDDSLQVKARSNPFLAVIRLSGLAMVTLYYLIVNAVSKGFTSDLENRRRATGQYFQKWARAIRRILGIAVEIRGAVPPSGALLTPNHQGYLDIVLLASVTPMVFVSKAEVRSWPVIGFLLGQAEQLLVSRNRAKDLKDSVKGIAERLKGGQSVCVFLEGTTTGGDHVLRFFPALLQPAIDAGAPVVPTVIRWRARRGGMKVSRDVAYWGDHHFLRHAARLLGLGGISAVVEFGPPVCSEGAARRQLADRMHSEVVCLMEAADRANPLP
jgi:1-acyl-sn-glycerol-3-phosphate acyltransferase